MVECKADILIAGGGLGGVAAALTVASMGYKVIMTEETDWIGGQITAQAAPLDEHPWIESYGCTRSYRKFRNEIRRYYKKYYPLTVAAQSECFFNPGAALVSGLSCEPRAALAVLESFIAPHLASGNLTILKQYKALSVQHNGDWVESVTFRNLVTGDNCVVGARYFLDATDLGDLLPMAGVEYVSGAETQSETGELHAVAGLPQPHNNQAFTSSFALGYYPGENHTVDKPDEYNFWRSYKADFETAPHLSWNPRPSHRNELFPDPGSDRFSLWQFRRILYIGHFLEGFMPSDVTIMNCAQNDYWLGPIIDVPQAEARENIRRAKQLSLSFLYWMQTEAPRPDGGTGYPGLRLRKDVVGTDDGLSKFPYIRESRRIKAEFTVLEQHVGVEARAKSVGSEVFYDSVGVGSYRIDLHPGTNGAPSLNIPCWPFQIPLGSLIPVRVENMLPACKNIGVTHITNGCYRLHPIEWNIGEAAGLLSAFCLQNKLIPRQVRSSQVHVNSFQKLLKRLGVELSWPRLEHGTSYYRWWAKQNDWHWGESDHW